MRLRDAVTLAGWQQPTNKLISVYTAGIPAGWALPMTFIVCIQDKLDWGPSQAAVLREARAGTSMHRLENVGPMPTLEAPVVFHGLVHEGIAESFKEFWHGGLRSGRRRECATDSNLCRIACAESNAQARC